MPAEKNANKCSVVWILSWFLQNTKIHCRLPFHWILFLLITGDKLFVLFLIWNFSICYHTNLSFVVIFWWVCIQHFFSASNLPTDFVGAGVTGHWFTLPLLLPPCKTPSSNTSCVCLLETGNSLESEIKDLHSSLIKEWRNRAVG